MIRNYIRVAWRNLWKNKTYSALNIAGLAIGMAACIVIMVFVFYERSFDKMHSRNIYRLNEVQQFPGMVAPQKVALSMYPMASSLRQEFPEIINYARIRLRKDVRVNYAEKDLFIPELFWADSTFLHLFEFPLIQGDRKTALQEPNSLLLTRKMAENLFGSIDVVGRMVRVLENDTVTLKVTGILENVPENSHLQFGALISFNTYYNPNMAANWGSNWLVSYLELKPGTDPKALEKRFPDYLARHLDENQRKFYTLFLQHLKEVHSTSGDITHDYINYQKFDSTYTRLFSIIALIVLCIACINFMNLSTARSAGRAKEVGVRKSIGARRAQLAVQFLSESILIALFSLVIAIGLAKLLLPAAAALSERKLELPLFSSNWLLPLLLMATLLVGIVAGIYPALFLSGFKPALVLKNIGKASGKTGLLRNGLVIAQFSGAVFLIIATIFAVRQLRFMQRKDPGFSKEQVVLLPLNKTANAKFATLKAELLKNPLITSVSASQQRLGNNLHQTRVVYHGSGPERSMASSQVVVDPDFLKLYQIQLLAGRNFSSERSENGRTYIINESLAKELLKDEPKAEYESLLGKMFGFGGLDSSGSIIGVAKDFNFNSLHHKVETLCIFNQSDWGYSEASVKIQPGKSKEAIAYMQQTWAGLVGDHPFEYKFLDAHFEELYRADNQVSKIVAVLAGLAVFIACLGLFGLASFAAERRTREVGIRKVLGAGVFNLMRLLSWNFVRLVLLANGIAWILAWLVINKWLEGFAYRVSISPWVFVLAGLASILIAIGTVSIQAMRVSLSNPVNSLRSE